jgi:hypothetical protein
LGIPQKIAVEIISSSSPCQWMQLRELVVSTKLFMLKGRFTRRSGGGGGRGN